MSSRMRGDQRAAAPVLSGAVPPLADSFYDRAETGFGLADGLRPGETIVLAGSGDGGAGGTGKTQLAVGFAHALWSARAVDLLVWAPAASRDAVVSSFAQAAGTLDARQPGETRDGETADAAARRFVKWLGRTRHPWAVVLDDVTDVEDLDGLWPRGTAGQLVVTTRLPESRLRGHGRIVLAVGGFSEREGIGYLVSRLTRYPEQRSESFDLARDLGGLPLALAQAAAVIADAESTCRQYRAQFADRLADAKGAPTDSCPPELLATWSLALDRACELAPAGLAWPALVLASVLDTGGIPSAVLTSPVACGFITGQPAATGADAQDMVRAAYTNLARAGLVSIDQTSATRTVWLHAAIRAAVRAYLPPADVEQAVTAAASAVLDAWPLAIAAPGGADAEPPGSAPLCQALRDCAASLQDYAGDVLWKPEAHPLLLRAGQSLDESRLAESSARYWSAMAARSGELLGPGHAQSVMARDRLAAAYLSAGRLTEAVTAFEAALQDKERNLGADHPSTMATRVKLAAAYRAAGLLAQAVALYAQSLAESARLRGPAHPETLSVRSRLAEAYQAAGQHREAIAEYQRTLAERERAQGPDHPDTIAAGASLASAYQAAGKPANAAKVAKALRRATRGAG